MTRWMLSVLLAVALASVPPHPRVFLPADRLPADRPRPISDRTACKPEAPIEVDLIEVMARGERVELGFTIRPLETFPELSWELLLPADAVLLEGTASGTASGQRGLSSEGRVLLLLPQDDAFRQVRLVVRSVLQGSDETGALFDEPVAVARRLSWGAPPPPAPIVFTRDAESGAQVPVVALPVAHRPGR